MPFSNSKAIIIVLATSLSLVLGAQTIGQIIGNVESIEAAIVPAANGILEAPTISDFILTISATEVVTTNNNGTAANVTIYDQVLAGTSTLAPAAQEELIQATNKLFGAAADLILTEQNLSAYATNFSNAGQQSLLGTLKESVDNLDITLDKYAEDLAALGPNIAAPAIGTQIATVDAARTAFDAAFEAAGM